MEPIELVVEARTLAADRRVEAADKQAATVDSSVRFDKTGFGAEERPSGPAAEYLSM